MRKVVATTSPDLFLKGCKDVSLGCEEIGGATRIGKQSDPVNPVGKKVKRIMSESEVEMETPEFKGKATWRLGQREMTRISLGVIALIVMGLLYGGWKAVEGFKTKRDLVIAQENMRSLYQAMRSYALDSDSKLPPAENWADSVLGYLSSSQARPGGKEAYLIGTSELGTVGYVYNDAAAGYNLEPSGKEDDRQRKIDPSHLILLIERVGAPHNAHAYLPPEDSIPHQEELLKQLAFPHDADDDKNATTKILYADGNIVTVTRQDMKH